MIRKSILVGKMDEKEISIDRYPWKGALVKWLLFFEAQYDLLIQCTKCFPLLLRFEIRKRDEGDFELFNSFDVLNELTGVSCFRRRIQSRFVSSLTFSSHFLRKTKHFCSLMLSKGFGDFIRMTPHFCSTFPLSSRHALILASFAARRAFTWSSHFAKSGLLSRAFLMASWMHFFCSGVVPFLINRYSNISSSTSSTVSPAEACDLKKKIIVLTLQYRNKLFQALIYRDSVHSNGENNQKCLVHGHNFSSVFLLQQFVSIRSLD